MTLESYRSIAYRLKEFRATHGSPPAHTRLTNCKLKPCGKQAHVKKTTAYGVKLKLAPFPTAGAKIPKLSARS